MAEAPDTASRGKSRAEVAAADTAPAAHALLHQTYIHVRSAKEHRRLCNASEHRKRRSSLSDEERQSEADRFRRVAQKTTGSMTSPQRREFHAERRRLQRHRKKQRASMGSSAAESTDQEAGMDRHGGGGIGQYDDDAAMLGDGSRTKRAHSDGSPPSEFQPVRVRGVRCVRACACVVWLHGGRVVATTHACSLCTAVILLQACRLHVYSRHCTHMLTGTQARCTRSGRARQRSVGSLGVAG